MHDDMQKNDGNKCVKPTMLWLTNCCMLTREPIFVIVLNKTLPIAA